MDRTIVPTNFQSWPLVKSMVPDHKFIARELWCNPFIQASGVYQIDLDMFSVQIGFQTLNVKTALAEFKEKNLIDFDEETSEILILDWWRFHDCSKPSQKIQVKNSLNKILSTGLKEKVIHKILAKNPDFFKNNDLRPNYNSNFNSNLTQQQQPSPEVEGSAHAQSSGGDLKFPKIITQQLRDLILPILKGRDDAEILLDELGARMEARDQKPLGDPVAWLQALIGKGIHRTPAGLKKTAYRLELARIEGEIVGNSRQSPV